MLVTPTSRGTRRERGLSLVEMLVGVAVGMFIIAGASTLFVANLTSSRKLLVEARLNQDLRAAADVISRDLRRAGYWENAIAGTIALAASTATTANPYAPIASAAGLIEYRFARDGLDAVANTEEYGFQISSGGVLLMKHSTNPGTLWTWEPLTDPAAVRVTDLRIVPVDTTVPVGDTCARACAASSPGCPTVTIRHYDITLTGAAPTDPAVVRTLETRARVRNDLLRGFCPA